MRYMGTPLSIRFDEDLLLRLRRRAQATPGATISGLAQQLVEEGLRMGEHPGILFKDGPAGRRPATAYGPDVWEVIKFLREVDERGEAAVEATAEMMNLTEGQVRTAMHCYSAHATEIDDWIAQADAEADAAYAAWEAEQRLLA
jgi:hypothetical protein